MKNNTISILGCGWLGYPLAKELHSDGWLVRGSSKSEDTLQNLQNQHIQPFHINLNESIDNIDKDFLSSDYLIINIPPSKLMDPLKQYKNLSTLLDKSPIRKILFISSTSAYQANNGIAEEKDTEKLPDNFNRTISFERIFQKSDKEVIILRLAGLIGPQRHPGRFFATGKSLTNPHFPVNLIHLSDCIGIIRELLKSNQWGEIYNGCADTHPNKGEFYTKATYKFGRSRINIADPDTAEKGKIVSNQKIKSTINYQFHHPDLMKLLDTDNF